MPTRFTYTILMLNFQFVDGARGMLLDWDNIYENNEKAMQAWMTPLNPGVVVYHPDTIRAVFSTTGKQ